MFRRIAKWLNRKEYQRIEEDSAIRTRSDQRILNLLDVLEERDRELRETVLYRDALLKALPDLVFVHDVDGYYLDCYAPDDDLLIMPCDVIVGQHISSCFDPDMVQIILDTYKRIMTTRRMEVLEYKLTISGQEHDFEARIVPLNGDKLLSTVRDVTAWKQAQYKLAKQLTFQQGLIDKCQYPHDCPGSEDGTCRKLKVG